MLRLRIQEKEAREADIDSEIANMLARNAAIDEELMAVMAKFITMSLRMAELREKNKAFNYNMITYFKKCVGNTLSTNKRLVVVKMTLTLEQLQKTLTRKSSANLHLWAV